MDYSRQKLFASKLRVTRMTVTGLLCEQIQKHARASMIPQVGLTAADLPTHVLMSLDKMPGVRRVQVFPEDQALALAVAQVVEEELQSLDLQTVDCCVPVRNNSLKKLGEHDRLLQFVGDPRTAVLVLLRKYVSLELKLRRLWDPEEQQRIRKLLQDECVGASDTKCSCKWWCEQEHVKFAGRLLVMVVFPEKQGDKFKVCGDIRLEGDKAWRPIFGWLGSRRLLSALPSPSPTALAQQQAARAKAQAKTKAAPKPKAAPKAAAQGRTSRERFEAVVRALKFCSGYASVKEFLRKCPKKNPCHSSYWVNQGLEKGWIQQGQVKQVPRNWELMPKNKRKKLGGESEWVAQQRALAKLWEHFYG